MAVSQEHADAIVTMREAVLALDQLRLRPEDVSDDEIGGRFPKPAAGVERSLRVLFTLFGGDSIHTMGTQHPDPREVVAAAEHLIAELEDARGVISDDLDAFKAAARDVLSAATAVVEAAGLNEIEDEELEEEESEDVEELLEEDDVDDDELVAEVSAG